jgi:hypothetical protein
MKNIFGFFIFLAIHAGLNAQKDPMNYFLGKWDIRLWLSPKHQGEPDVKGTWQLERGAAKTFDAHGNVIIDKQEATKEQIGYDPQKGLYYRTITAQNGLFFFTSKGWDGDKLVWEGYMVPLSDQKIEMKEEITRVSKKEFHAAFFRKKDETWEETTHESLMRN